ncbi:hypothetical protein MACH09_38860 [Vibrio sp. MACH09]|uniref:hypothetical protein n=1 Tax=Vibrio sp. MACH09 TaxID=3025122 RepID=UPI00278FC489|nr:hypothetical protein [Vibrio sp. MACH09]GLO63378.1 hypothetical protein MACH09_38860 [Vibrio sp. MACH09]
MKKTVVLLLVTFNLFGCTSKREIAKAEFESILQETGYFHCSYEDLKSKDGEYKKSVSYKALVFDKVTHQVAVLNLFEPVTDGVFETSNITDSFVSGYFVRGDKENGFDVKYYRNTSNMNLDYIFRMSGSGKSEDCDYINK